MNRRRVLALTGALMAGVLAGCTGDARRSGGTDPSGPATTGEPTPRSTTATARGSSEPSGTGTPSGGTGTPASGTTPALSNAPEPGVVPDIDDETLAELARNTNALAVDLYGELVGANAGTNLLASPASITTALSMAYAGARGETRTQMREALHYPLDGDALHAAFNALQRELNARGRDIDEDDFPSNYDPEDDPVPFKLDLVNSVWGQEGFPFREEYLSILADHYGGGLREVDYKSDPGAARQTINAWVAERTNDRIEDLLPKGSLTTLTRLVLVNAIYFMANWHEPFEEDNTEYKPFTALDGSTTEVPMMSQSTPFPYAEVDGARAVDLPYLGKDVSMLLILPPEGGFESFERALDRSTIARLVDALETRKGVVSLPRFEFESSFALEETLRALGMPIAFNEDAANFYGIAPREEIGPRRLYIHDVYHDTYIAVDETGTEAAAATGVVINLESGPSYEFVADRPFLFAIRDRPTGTILFLGRVVDAGAAQPQ